MNAVPQEAFAALIFDVYLFDGIVVPQLQELLSTARLTTLMLGFEYMLYYLRNSRPKTRGRSAALTRLARRRSAG